MHQPTVTEVLTRLAEVTNGCAPTQVSIGAVVNGTCRDNVVLVQDACAKVTKAVVNEFEFVSVGPEGLFVQCRKEA